MTSEKKKLKKKERGRRTNNLRNNWQKHKIVRNTKGQKEKKGKKFETTAKKAEKLD